MEFLARALDDPNAGPCGKCVNCTGRSERRMPAPALVQEAIDFLRSDHLIIEPRVRWPRPLLGQIGDQWPEAIERYDNGRPKIIIPEPLRAEEGRVLCLYGDGGWGQEVARGKYETSRFS